MKIKASIRAHIESHYPIIYLVTFEEAKTDALIEGFQDDHTVVEWNLADGIVDFKTKRSLTECDNLAKALPILSSMVEDGNAYFIVIKDAHLALRDNPLAVVRLKALANRLIHDDHIHATIFLIASQAYVPPELEKLVTLFEIPLPGEKEIREIIVDHAEALRANVPDNEELTALTLAFRGLSEHEIRQLLNRGYQQDGNIGKEDLDLVRSEKEQIIKKTGILEMLPHKESESIADIGGLDQLKRWLEQKRKVLADLTAAKKFGVDAPKGVMIVGMPGCGKSLTAKAAAHLFGLPLLRLDVGRLMGRYVGDSESNMRRALALAEAVSPCVLWIDELEKAFAGVGSGGSGGGGGSEVTSRLFGFFLTWMQEKSGAVFVIATANDITALPPELLRRGRFDEIFYVDFPDREEAEKILEIHLRKRRPRDLERIDVAKLAKETEGYCGADLESAIKDAVEKAFVEGRKSVSTDDVRNAIKATRPLSEVMKDRIGDYRKRFSALRIRPASGLGK
jgi:SpoVK/Ycf46/Vps4 family AAA+-type ATPase